MGSLLVSRLWQSVLMLLVMSAIVFTGVYMLGDPMTTFVFPGMSPEAVEKMRRDLGFDQPLYVQYAQFLRAAVQGDLGVSFTYSEPAIKVILQRLPATFELACVAMLIALVVGVPLGMYAGLNPKRRVSRAIMGFSVLGFSIPGFWVALMLIVVFSVQLGWLPTSGRGPTVAVFGVPLSVLTLDGWRHLLLPALNLALFPLALILRLTRAGVVENMRLDYVRFLRAKGLQPSRIMFFHVLKNVAIPIVTVTGLSFGSLLAFAVVTETIFAWPGMGKLIVDAIAVLDRPVVVAYILVTCLIFATLNLLMDLAYAALDPRVRLAVSS
ncbi:ABC transporter permease [Variovorax paradoxus]|jgi:peptide/nickel transport system permease protein|uniref:ABC transporter permease n=1 Tax=Variovorax paradoxus TaxID=34073 RepID=UPI0006E6A7C7|nr:ABC transporter permease [Variovorax paradoxus]KPV02428.1 ABC transporter permease [Variovorax paradoxus]KPV03715.1 ABC transporter permease [Variovorax paradoxus]KPV18621.1 ABC transporter permease [Variovorax paradoxus]KPV29106.1 ABC transporter permease [Variovorax paradoxus]